MESKAGLKENVSSEESLIAEESEYEIYLYPEYSTIVIGTNVEMTATLNFKTDSVNITAYFESGGNETVSLIEKNATEWKNTVKFDKLGIHKIVITATAPNGKIIENSIEVEVIAATSQIFNTIFNGLLEWIQTEY